MHPRVRKDWELPGAAVTPEREYFGRERRRFIKAAGLGAVGTFFLGRRARGAQAGFPAAANPDYSGAGLNVTPFKLATSYNNFYEFGTDKGDPVIEANSTWKPEPWTVEIGGLARNPGKWDLEDLVRKMGGLEERIYRHRCVEAWSMVIPWDGFPLRKLVDFADPAPGARFVRFTSFLDPRHAPGQQEGNYWPYVEGLHIKEARHELAFIATGIYGKPLPNQNGAPWRLVVPWKYGFKGIKSIVKVELVAQMPANTWNILAPDEYGFLANVNPQVDHPRWSQKSERIIDGSFFGHSQPTLMFNGYEKQVAALYQGVDLRRFY